MKNYLTLFATLVSLCLSSCSNDTEVETKNEEPMENSNDFDFEAMMEKFNNRPIYSELKIEHIDSTSDDELIQLVFDNLTTKLEDNYEREFEIITSLSEERQTIYAIWLVEAEVNNGGFNQFYVNSSGQFAEIAEMAFKNVNSEKLANLMAKANKIWQEENLAERQDGSMESFSESYEDNPLNDLDSEFYDLCESESLFDLQVQFIRNNKEKFVD